MSLISQHAFHKNRADEVKDEEETLLRQESEEAEVPKESSLKSKRKKKGHMEKEEEKEVEEENEETKKRKKRRKEDRKQIKEEEEEEAEEEKEEEERRKRKKMRKEDKKQLEEEENEMKKHESFLFGSLYSLTEFGKEEKEARHGVDEGPALFFTDRSGNGAVTVYEEEEETEYQVTNNEIVTTEKKPAWVDDEEETTHRDIAKINRLRKYRTKEDESCIPYSEFISRARAQFVKMNPGTEWAQLGSKLRNYDDSDEEIGPITDLNDDSILRSNEDLVMKSNVKLLPGRLEYSRLVDANIMEPSDAPINSVQFHRNSQLLLAAGLDRRIRFFQIDGKRNTKIDSMLLEDCPIYKASFLRDGSQAIMSGRRKFFYSIDIEKMSIDRIGPLIGRDEKSLEVFEVSPDSRTIAFLGDEGYILLVSCKTKELIGTLKMNGTARSLAFNDDGSQLISSGGDGHIYHWDLRTRTCFHKAIDEGCIMGSSLGTSPNGSLLAAGSSSGIVNVYNHDEFLGGKRKPIKTIENLTTTVDMVKFNHDAQIMAICSRMQKNSLKLVHVPSFSVFSNWPPVKGVLHYPRCLDFSPGGGFMAMGNAAGNVFLYKLHHYQHA